MLVKAIREERNCQLSWIMKKSKAHDSNCSHVQRVKTGWTTLYISAVIYMINFLGTYVKFQNSFWSGFKCTCFLEYVLPLMLPSHTSKPASASMNPKASYSGLVTQFVLEQRRPCWRKATGLGRVATEMRNTLSGLPADIWNRLSITKSLQILYCMQILYCTNS